jgi:uncharacterized protein (TIGR00730 family)
MNPAFSVCVYCGSRPGVQHEYAQAARTVGNWIGQHGGQLVYGGGKSGLMGITAQATLEAGGQVIGIIPTALMEKEWALDECTELHIVSNMHERKRMMAERADAFLTLPGGIGTLEELFEVWTWRQLGYHDKPVGILNVAGYFDGLLTFMGHTVEAQFLSDWQMDLVHIGSDPQAMLEKLVQSAGLSPDSQLDKI